MKLLLSNLHEHAWRSATIRSLDGCVYRLEMDDGKQTRLVWQDARTVLTTRNLTRMRELLTGAVVEKIVLLHDSAYDEMVGQPPSSGNQMQIALSLTDGSTSPH